MPPVPIRYSRTPTGWNPPGSRWHRARLPVLGAGLLAGAAAAAAPPTAEIASTPDDPLVLGVQAIDDAGNCQLSRDGRILLFTSEAWNLLPDDHNRISDVFIRDRIAGRLSRLVRPGGIELVETPAGTRLSGDGRWVAFHTEESLVPNDTNDELDVYLWKRNDGSIELISRSSAGVAVGGHAPDPSFDARYVAFLSDASALAGTSGVQAFRLDRDTGAIAPLSVGASGSFGNASAESPRVIGARWVAFASSATDLVAGDSNGQRDVFVRDLQLGLTRRVSVGPAGAQLPAASFLHAAVVGAAPVVAFSTSAVVLAGDTNGTTDLFRMRLDNGALAHLSPAVTGGFRADGVLSTATLSQDGTRGSWAGLDGGWDPADSNGAYDIFMADAGGNAQRLSISPSGAPADGNSTSPCADDDAGSIAFSTDATNLVPGDRNGVQDVVLCEGTPCVFERMSVADTARPIAVDRQRSKQPDVSADGRFVAFASEGRLLAPGASDDLSDSDIVVRDRALLRTFLLTPGDATGSEPVVSDDGRYVAFRSRWMPPLYTATSLLQTQAFVHDRVTGSTRLLSVSATGAPADAPVTAVAISANGCCVVFASAAGNLVSGDANGRSDIFIAELAAGTLTRIAPAGGAGGGASPRISRDGRRIVFESYDSDYATGDNNGSTDVFVHDRSSQAYFRLSMAGATEPDNESYEPDISDDGRVVVFTSIAQNLPMPPLASGNERLYRVTIDSGALQPIGRRPDGAPLRDDDEVYGGRLSANGAVVAYFGDYDDLVVPGAPAPVDENGFVLREEGAAVEVFSTTPSGAWVNDPSDRRAIAIDGSGNRLALATDSGLFQPLTDHNETEDVFLLVRNVPVDAVFGDGFE